MLTTDYVDAKKEKNKAKFKHDQHSVDDHNTAFLRTNSPQILILIHR